MRGFFFLLLFVFCTYPFGVSAQSISSSEPLTLRFSPAYPRPYDQVTVTVESTQVTLAASDIAISVDGTIIEEGKRSASFRLGGPGTASVVRASATSPEGAVSAQRTLRPVDVALIIEPSSSSHPFYKGGLLIPSEGSLRLIALADLRSSPGTRLSNSDISYTWKVGDRVLSAESGLGKNILAATAPPRYRSTIVTVTAASRDGSLLGEASLSISPVDPVLRIYPADPLSGVDFSTALSGPFAFMGNEEGFRAVPYFFREQPSYVWRLNGTQSGTKDAITVRAGGGSGTATLSASATLSGASADSSVTLRFENAPTGFFGL